jgi:hypothetical protein
MMTFLRVLGIVAFALLTWFTSAKLIKMAQIRGLISGPVPESKTITSKIVLEDNYGEAYWLAWNDVDIRRRSRDRINLPQDIWRQYSVGDQIEVLYFPGDRKPYHRRDIFAENGNFAFDGGLLTVWLLGLATLTIFQVRHLRRNRPSTPPPLPGALSQ